jgi:hypothetical protein
LDFQKKTGKFGVLTYCNNYLEVESSCETFDVILYTNRTLDWETTQDKFVINDGTDKFSVLMTECQAHPLLSTNREEPSTESRGRNRTPGNVVLGRSVIPRPCDASKSILNGATAHRGCQARSDRRR